MVEAFRRSLRSQRQNEDSPDGRKTTRETLFKPDYGDGWVKDKDGEREMRVDCEFSRHDSRVRWSEKATPVTSINRGLKPHRLPIGLAIPCWVALLQSPTPLHQAV